MTLPIRTAAHLAVLGAALVVAGARPAGPGAPSAAAATATYRPPTAWTLAAPQRARSTWPHRPAARRHAARQPRRRPQAAAAPRTAGPRPAQPVRTRHTAARRAPFVSGPTHWSALNAAISRIPTYRPGAARWVVSRRYGYWGTADWYHDVLYIAPTVPTQHVYDVAVHEWSHELSVLDYDGDVSAAVAAMDDWFGGRGLVGAERAADCMAILQGASWTHYTSCSDARWRAGAAKLVSGREL